MACIKSLSCLQVSCDLTALHCSVILASFEVSFSDDVQANKICHARNAFFRLEARKNFCRGLEKQNVHDCTDVLSRRDSHSNRFPHRDKITIIVSDCKLTAAPSLPKITQRYCDTRFLTGQLSIFSFYTEIGPGTIRSIHALEMHVHVHDPSISRLDAVNFWSTTFSPC